MHTTSPAIAPENERFIPTPPVASVAHVSETEVWTRILPDRSNWRPRSRRATHRSRGSR